MVGKMNPETGKRDAVPVEKINMTPHARRMLEEGRVTIPPKMSDLLIPERLHSTFGSMSREEQLAALKDLRKAVKPKPSIIKRARARIAAWIAPEESK